MPLQNSVIQRLNDITTTIENKNKLTIDDESIINKKFRMIGDDDSCSCGN